MGKKQNTNKEKTTCHSNVCSCTLKGGCGCSRSECKCRNQNNLKKAHDSKS